ncbi:FUSC family protein [Kitasatospora atroaurantiaca]|uniref:Putative membrane protein YccC n=1 Tax=Kitasatospora atroaurantiaca TaxID=285545 RepID=A0A561EUB9_9ACTN|nr:FUSC family protein [Kitasatospora atroaurantiaca]TWE19171.1 putative membrane protein YccC [Kitasatospora atroaurantiaca]
MSAPGRSPAWWARAARPARPPLPRALMVRAALGMATPLFLGLLTGRLDLGVFAGLGAMHATMNDRVEPIHLRAPRIASALLASALGMLIGAALQHHRSGPLTVGLALTTVAFASGAVSATGPRGSAAGMLLLVSASLGGGMALPHPWWAAPPMMLLGAAYVVLLGLPYRPRPQADPRRRALAAAYDALGGMLATLGTPQGARSRQLLTARLNQVQDLLPHLRPGRQEPPHVGQLRRSYHAALAATEAASGLLWAWRPVPAEVAALPGELARAVLGGPQPEYPVWEPGTPALKALDVALRAAADTVAGRPAVLDTASAPPPDPWRLRVRLLSGGSVRYGLRVALCIAVAEAVTAGLPLSRSYWVPMTVAFVLKPDLGSVFLRAVSRSVGTVLGVAVTAALLLLTTDQWALAAIASVCVALLPWSAAAHYGLNTAVMTPMALVLVQLGGGSGAAEFWPRVLDTTLASVIVLVFGYVLWPERPPHRIEPRIAAATTALREYLASVVEERRAPVAEVWLRRTAYRALADARQEVQHGLTEPPPAGRLAEQWLPATAALERLSGAVAAYAAQIRYGGREPEPAEAARVFAALDHLTGAARAHRPPTGLAARPAGPHDPALSALARAAHELEILLRASP